MTNGAARNEEIWLIVLCSVLGQSPVGLSLEGAQFLVLEFAVLLDHFPQIDVLADVSRIGIDRYRSAGAGPRHALDRSQRLFRILLSVSCFDHFVDQLG